MRRFFYLFLLSFCLCIGVGGLTRTAHAQQHAQIEAQIKAQVQAQGPAQVQTQPFSTEPIAEGLEQGLARYQQGDILGAIALWQQSLSASNSAPDSSTQSITARQYLARAYQQIGQFSEAMSALESLSESYRQRQERQPLGRVLTEQAQIYNELGQPQNAASVLCAGSAEAVCVGGENSETVLIADRAANPSADDAQLGAIAIAAQQTDRKGQAAALGVLGQTYYLQGRYDAAISALESSLAIARENQYRAYQISANETLGNVQARLSQRRYKYAQFAKQAQDSAETQRLTAEADAANQLAISYFQQALAIARSPAQQTAQTDTQAPASSALRSQLNLVVPTYRATGSAAEAQSWLSLAEGSLAAMPAGRAKAYAAIRIASLSEQVQTLSQQATDSKLLPAYFTQCVAATPLMAEQLQQAVSIAQDIQDTTAESFALGWLGYLYECAGDYSAAQQLSNRAQLLASAPETRYLWEWQSGRILAAQGRSSEAIERYEQAVTTLQQVESDIAVASRDLRLDFRDTVENIYRELTKLQLSQVVPAQKVGRAAMKETVESAAAGQSNLLSALRALDGLRLAELRNYLGGECDLPLLVDETPSLSPTTASISTLVVDDKLAVILALPNEQGGVQAILHELPLSQAALTEQVNSFRYALEQRSDRTNRYLDGAQQFYDQLVRPFEADLRDHNIQTLTFNHDGILRTLPMAALHDGNQFLVELFAIANSSSFSAVSPTLFTSNRTSNRSRSELAQGNLQVLAFGLTDAAIVSPSEQFSPLAAVAVELSQIEETLPNATVFLNESFTVEQLRSRLLTSSFSVLHLATHAQFGYDADDTFLVTGEKGAGDRYNQTLRLNALYRLLREAKREQSSPLQMLLLSACETAVGSERDALGIAGVAIQAGVESAVASLWQVDDSATAQLTTDFYRALRSGEQRSLALQTAQRDWLQSAQDSYRHPGYWAALVLVENGVS